MSSLTLWIVENDEGDRELCREVLTTQWCEPHLCNSAITFLTRPVFFEQWHMLPTALRAFCQRIYPDVRPL